MILLLKVFFIERDERVTRAWTHAIRFRIQISECSCFDEKLLKELRVLKGFKDRAREPLGNIDVLLGFNIESSRKDKFAHIKCSDNLWQIIHKITPTV